MEGYLRGGCAVDPTGAYDTGHDNIVSCSGGRRRGAFTVIHQCESDKRDRGNSGTTRVTRGYCRQVSNSIAVVVAISTVMFLFEIIFVVSIRKFRR